MNLCECVRADFWRFTYNIIAIISAGDTTMRMAVDFHVFILILCSTYPCALIIIVISIASAPCDCTTVQRGIHTARTRQRPRKSISWIKWILHLYYNSATKQQRQTKKTEKSWKYFSRSGNKTYFLSNGVDHSHLDFGRWTLFNVYLEPVAL